MIFISIYSKLIYKKLDDVKKEENTLEYLEKITTFAGLTKKM